MKKVVFIGSKELGFSVFKKLYQLDNKSLIGCITIDDREDTRTCYSDYCNFCNENEIDLFVLSKAKDLNDVVYSLKPDMCFVLGWYYIIDQKVIDSVPMGFIGIHNSLLPRYRGFAPLVWSIINGETQVGFSLFDFSEKMDEGDIWATGRVDVEDNDSISDVIEKINNEIIVTLDNVYLKILRGEIKPRKQENGTPSYGAKRIPEDGVIDWTQPSLRVHNFIRAQSDPYPGAYSFMNGKKLIIWKTELKDTIYYGTPGQVASICKDGVLIICGDSKGILIKEIEYEGVRESAIDLIKSLNIRLG